VSSFTILFILFLTIPMREAIQEALSRFVRVQAWVVVSTEVTSLAARMRAVRVLVRRWTASARNNRFAIRTFVKAVQSLFQIWSQIAINITGTMPQSERINKHCWVIRDVIVKVGPSVEVEWVLAKESPRRRAVV